MDRPAGRRPGQADRILQLGLLLFLVAATVLQVGQQESYQLILALGAAVLALLALGRPGLQPPPAPLAAVALAFLFSVTHSLFLAPSGYSARSGLARRGMEIGVLTASLGACASPLGVQALRAGVLLSAGAATLSAVSDRQTGVAGRSHWMGKDERARGASRVAGLFPNPNLLGAFLALCLPLALGVARRGDAGALVLASLLSAGIGAGLGMSFSRSSWVVAGVGALALVALSRGRRRFLAAPLVATVLALFLSTPGVTDRVLSTAQAGNFGISQRLALFQGVANMVVARPFLGFGVGSFHSAYPLHRVVGGQYPYDAHGQYLQEAVDTGILGVALFLLVIASTLSAMRKLRRRPDPPERQDLFASLAALAVLFLFASPLHYSSLGVLVAALVGAAAAPPEGGRTSRPEEGEELGAGTQRVLVATVLGAVLVSGAASWGSAPRSVARAGIRALEGIPAGSDRIAAAGDLSAEILEAIRAAESRDPGAPEHRYLEAQLLFDMGLFEESEDLFHQTLARNPLEGLAWQGIARTRAARGDLTGSLEAVDAALALDPLAEAALHQRAEILMDLGEEEQAQEVLLAALETNPAFLAVNRSTYPRIMLTLIHLLERRGDSQGAALWRDRYLDLYGDVSTTGAEAKGLGAAGAPGKGPGNGAPTDPEVEDPPGAGSLSDPHAEGAGA